MNPCPVFGNHLRLSIRGASHAPHLAFSLAHFPEGFAIDREELKAFMERRAPGRDDYSTTRVESDEVLFDEGVASSVEPASRLLTTGATIKGRILNTNMRPADYGNERTIPRPGHADFPQWIEAGRIPTGGGANSGRLTAALCAAGGICKQFLARRGIEVSAHIEKIHGRSQWPEEEILKAKRNLDSVGGTIVCTATGMPAGLGGALFGGLETELAGAVFAIPGVKGLEFGNGFACCDLTGSENNDAFVIGADGEVKTETNRQGGILGGRTSGMPIEFRVALRPTATVFKELKSVDLATMQNAVCAMKGRHDPCIVRRAVPVVEAVAAFVLADLILGTEAASPRICLTLTGKTLEEDLAQYRSQRYFTDLVELRVDLLTPAARARAAEFPAMVKVPVILTFRRKVDGGAFEGPEAERVAFFRQVLPGSSFTYVDFEDDFRHADLAALARAAGVRIIRSRHVFDGTYPLTARTRSDTILGACRALRGATDEIPKIAFMPKTAADVDRLFAETASFTDFPHILCAMGPLGLRSRVLAVRTHSLLTYASVGGLGQIGHVTPHELVRDYRLRTVTPSARVEYVAPSDVARTNARFAAAEEDAVALPLTVMG